MTFVEKNANALSSLLQGTGTVANAILGGVGRVAKGVGSLTKRWVWDPTAGKMIDLSVQGGGKLLGGIARGGVYTGAGITGAAVHGAVKHPLAAVGTGAALFANKDNIKDVVTGRRYQNLVAPYRGTITSGAQDSGFGRRVDPFHYSGVHEMEKTFSLRLPTMGQLEKVAFWPAIGGAALSALGGLASHIAGPSLKTIGTKIQDRMFGTTGGEAALTEYAKQRAKTLAKIEAVKQLQDEETRKTSKQVMPIMQTMYTALKSSDKDIAEAAKDKQLHGVMQTTMHTVANFAPSIATDPRALQSVLREAISSPEGGLSFQTIKHLSETQKFINEARNKKWAD